MQLCNLLHNTHNNLYVLTLDLNLVAQKMQTYLIIYEHQEKNYGTL